MSQARNSDRIVVVGSGIAGLATALSLGPAPVTVVTAGTLAGLAATCWAQGGIAAALGGDDSPKLHAEDTLAAGAGLGDPAVAREVAEAAPACIEALIAWGVAFDRDTDGSLALGLEGAHRRRRIVHAGGDASGAAILAALARAARRTPSIEIVEGLRVGELLVEDGAVVGLAGWREGRAWLLPARAVVLATGGSGGLYASTTNPLGATGSGVALAARAGAVLRDLEFVQFHPTAIALAADPMPLASEAIRGEGAVLVDRAGERIMAGIPGGDLAPRDVVTRAIAAEIARGREVFLDARGALGERFATRFPTITARCRAAGLDPARMPIPVRPAAHYHMGGVRVDARGRTSVPGLRAAGEVAASGLHGANRLASNSLLEAVVTAQRIAADLTGLNVRRSPRVRRPTARALAGRPEEAAHERAAIRAVMERDVGVVRDAAGLERAVRRLAPAAWHGPGRDMALAGLLVATSALRRAESRGAHHRSDHPQPSEDWRCHSDLTLGEIWDEVGRPEEARGTPELAA